VLAVFALAGCKKKGREISFGVRNQRERKSVEKGSPTVEKGGR